MIERKHLQIVKTKIEEERKFIQVPYLITLNYYLIVGYSDVLKNFPVAFSVRKVQFQSFRFTIMPY